MKPFKRRTRRVTVRSRIIADGAMTCLALSVTPAAAESNETASRPFRVNVPDADLADLKRRVRSGQS